MDGDEEICAKLKPLLKKDRPTLYRKSHFSFFSFSNRRNFAQRLVTQTQSSIKSMYDL